MRLQVLQIALACVMLCDLTAAREMVPAKTLEEPAETLLMSPLAARGDVDGLRIFWLEQAADDSLLSEDALDLCAGISPEELANPAAGEKTIRKILARESCSAELKDKALALLATCLSQKGKHAESMEIHRQRGIVHDWQLAGPFGKYGHADFYRIFAPEKRGEENTVTWHKPVSPDICLPAIDPWQWVVPGNGVVYLRAQFSVSRERQLLLFSQSSSSHEISVNHRKTLRVDRLAAELPFDQCALIKTLPGWNQILVKTYGGGRFTLRLLDPDHRPAANIKWENGEQYHPVKEGERPASQPEAAHMSEKTLLSAPLLALLATRCREQGLIDEAVHHIRRAIKLAPDNPWFRIILGSILMEAEHLPESARNNLLHQTFRAALDLDSDSVPALLGTADYRLRMKQYREAIAFIDKALTINPRSVRAMTMRARIAIRNRWLSEAEAWTSQLVRIFPNSLASCEVQAFLATVTRNFPILEEACSRAINIDQASSSWRLRQARCLVTLDRRKDAATALAALPSTPDMLEESARLLLRMGDATAAETACRKALKSLPEHAPLWRLLGDILHTLGNDSLPAYRKSLALRPSQHRLRRLIANLARTNCDPWQKYAKDPFTVIKEIGSRQFRSNTATLVDQCVVTIYPDGSSQCFFNELTRIVTRTGIDAVESQLLRDNIIEARTILPDGRSIVEPTIVPGRSRLTMPALRPEATVEIQYLRETRKPFDGIARLPKWYFRSPRKNSPFVFSQYIVRVPRNYPIEIVSRSLGDKVGLKTTSEGEMLVYSWTARNMPGARHEEGATDISERLPSIEIAGKRSWSDINHLLENTYLGRLRVTREINALAGKLLAGITTPLEKVKILHRFVCDSIQQTVTSRAASQILHQRTGNRLILLMALLRCAELDPILVAARPDRRMLHEPSWKIPEVSYFPLRLVAVDLPDNRRLYLDTRFRTITCGELLEDTAGATAFLVGPGRGEFTKLPPRDNSTFTVTETRNVTQSTTTITISGERMLQGLAAHKRKRSMLAVGKRGRHSLVETEMSSMLTGVSLESLSLPGLEKPGTPYHEVYELKSNLIPDLRASGILATRLFLSPVKLLPLRNRRADKRTTDFHLKQAVILSSVTNLLLPEKATVSLLPRHTTIHNQFGSYHLRAERRDGKVVIRRSCSFAAQRIPVKLWPAFVLMAEKIRKAEDQMVEWKMKR